MERLKTFVFAILAGAAIAIGGAAFLSVESKIVGSVLFTVGLFTVCTFGLNLYTGKVCYLFENKIGYTLDVVIIWLGNLAGTFLAAQAFLASRIGPAMAAKALTLCDAKLGDGLFSIFILAIFCNVMIFIGVDGFKRNPHELGKYLALFFGVVVFIICGFEHCVANMFYFSVAGVWSAKAFGYLIVMTLGNAVGGVIFPLLRMWKEKKAQ